MSAISGVSSGAQLLLAQQLDRARAGQNAGDGAAKWKAAFESALKNAGADPAKLSDLEQQIRDAVESARQNSSGSPDQRSAVRDAVNNVLKQNGIDPAKFEAELKAHHTGGHRHHRHGGAAESGGAGSTQAQEQTAQAVSTGGAPISGAPASSSTTQGMLNLVA